MDEIRINSASGDTSTVRYHQNYNLKYGARMYLRSYSDVRSQVKQNKRFSSKSYVSTYEWNGSCILNSKPNNSPEAGKNSAQATQL